MTGVVDWAINRARMIVTFVIMSIAAGTFAYLGLPKEGSPDIDIPVVFVSVPFQGISAEDSEKLLVKPMESRLKELEGLTKLTGSASENFGAVIMEFEFDWDKDSTLADIRDKMKNVESQFPQGADQYSVNEINFSQFPILVVALSGQLPERTLLRVAKDLQDEIEALTEVLEAGLAGHREEMLEVTIDPLGLEAYNVTAGELINVVTNNNQLIAAGEIKGPTGSFAVKIPSSFDEPQDIYDLPVKVNGDRVITLGDLAEIKLTFEDETGTARFNAEPTVALQVVMRKGANIIDTVAVVEDRVREIRSEWPEELKQSVSVNFAMDMSAEVDGMVNQLEASVLTAIALVMIVVLATLGMRSALLVGFAIPTSFLLCFALLAVMGVSISNIVMFGLILAVGMLVDGAIVVVEFADKRIQAGVGPMRAYGQAAKRMFWPIVSSTATTLCAFLPMLFWPGVPGEFMGMLPVTLIFVLSASLVVALIYLPVIGGIAGRISRDFENRAARLRKRSVVMRLGVVILGGVFLFLGTMLAINPNYLNGGPAIATTFVSFVIAMIVFLIGSSCLSIGLGSLKPLPKQKKIQGGYRRKPFGHFIHLIAGNPVAPVLSIFAVIGFVAWTFIAFGNSGRTVEFFVETDPERAIAYIQARGNLSVQEKDALVRQAEDIIIDVDGVSAVFAFAGDGGLNQFTDGATVPSDTVGQVQIELTPWYERIGGPTGVKVLDDIQIELDKVPGIQSEILQQEMGPGSAKPVHLRLTGDDWESLIDAATLARAKFDQTQGLTKIEDTRPLPGIDWRIDVDVEKAGRFGADVVTVGAMVQLVTDGLLLDKMRVDSSDEEIDIRVRLPEKDRLLATLDTLKVRTTEGQIPLSNFITRTPVKKLAQISRVDSVRHFDVKSDVDTSIANIIDTETDAVLGTAVQIVDDAGKSWDYSGNADPSAVETAVESGAAKIVALSPSGRIAELTEWLETSPFPAGIDWEWTGDQDDQAESAAFLQNAFLGALGLMFVILLAQFNSFYNSILVLLAVILSTTGVLIGMMVMDQNFSIIMTGTGIVALAGIVVNNNIVLIDTYQEYSKFMPKLEAIVRTAEDRIRPVLLTTGTTMAGLAPMMYGVSLNFFDGGYSIDAPTALWWKQLATAVVFGLGIATVLTLIFTPSMLALRIWITRGAGALSRQYQIRIQRGDTGEQLTEDSVLRKLAREMTEKGANWSAEPKGAPQSTAPLEAAE
jgi:multidrug efflux pump